MENAFEQVASVVSELTTDLRLIAAAKSLAHDYGLPAAAWTSAEDRLVELQKGIDAVWENAVRVRLTERHAFNRAWDQALKVALQERVLIAAND